MLPPPASYLSFLVYLHIYSYVVSILVFSQTRSLKRRASKASPSICVCVFEWVCLCVYVFDCMCVCLCVCASLLWFIVWGEQIRNKYYNCWFAFLAGSFRQAVCNWLLPFSSSQNGSNMLLSQRQRQLLLLFAVVVVVFVAYAVRVQNINLIDILTRLGWATHTIPSRALS